ncbi:MAG: hypothetical protein HOM96_01040 [Rickettsiales bacterium]|jgi:hypothetical protein|nr:hypothetical protein [Rickettsiales bacterium]
MRVVGLLIYAVALSGCMPPAYDFDYNNEKVLYGVGNSPPGSNFPSIPAFIDNPALKDPDSFSVPQSSAPQNKAPATNQQYNNPYLNPYGSSPYGSSNNINANKNKMPNNNYKAPPTSSNQPNKLPHPTMQGKDNLYMGQPNSVPNYQYNPTGNKPPQANNIRRNQQKDRYRGLTKTNKKQVIDTNIFSQSDRDRFDLLESDSFAPNNNFEKYRPMYKDKRSKQTQEFVDSLQGSLLEEMIQNDPVSNGFGLDNIPKY